MSCLQQTLLEPGDCRENVKNNNSFLSTFWISVKNVKNSKISETSAGRDYVQPLWYNNEVIILYIIYILILLK